ncbi:MAG TPA: glycosyltransferase family 2 protein [Dehalococcoidia bacterium]|nr:glycosyltransferase family 2 protein [Dehalococcoidia bacterium]
MVEGAPSVGVIVVNYNSAAFIDEFCTSLRAVDYPNWRLVVIDSASTDGSMDAIDAAFPLATRIRCDDNIGFAAGANIGIARCLERGDDYLLFLNDDATLTPGFLQRLVDAADARTMVVPKILYYADHRLISTHAGGFDWRLGVFRDTYAGRPDGPATSVRRDGIATASFCCALVPLQAFRDAGTLDERFFMYYEETDFIRRAQQAGFRLRYEPSAVVYHRESGSSGGGWMTPFKQYYATRNRIYLVRKHARSRAAYAWFTAYFWATRIPSAARLAARREWRLLRAMALGVRDYYRGRMGRTRQVRDL